MICLVGTYGVGVWLHSFFNLSATLEWVVYTMPWLLHPLGKICVTLSTEGWVGGQPGGLWKISPPLCFETQTVQSIVSCCTD